ncbi:hypothetical protein D1007_40427 [Hordeum vulgare]|nr:hypothetical protein D1007_40427 [Hordeum vulgare]
MPSGWRLSVDGVSMAPVPEPGTHLFTRAVGLYRAWLSSEEMRDPLYAPNHPAWPDMLAADGDARLHAFAGPRQPVKHNRAQLHQLRDGRSFKEVVAPHRVQAATGAITVPSTPASLPSAAAPRGPPASPATVEAPTNVRRSCLAAVTTAMWPLARQRAALDRATRLHRSRSRSRNLSF